MPEGWLRGIEDELEIELETGAADHPFRPSVLRWAAASGRTADPGPALLALEGALSTGGLRRHPWQLPVASWIPLERRVAWRPAEAEMAERHATEHAERLWVPAAMTSHLAWLDELRAGQETMTTRRAKRLVDGILPGVEDGVAERVAGLDTWADTFLLWTFARSPRALKDVHGLVSAIGARYAARAGRTAGIVQGRSFPWFEQPMVSASAHLAVGAIRVGEGSRYLASLLDYLRASMRPAGDWGDHRQPADLLTTMAATEAFGYVDPGFDMAAAIDAIGSLATPYRGRPAVIGPEWPWLATEIVELAAWAGLPFAERFRWPHVPDWGTDPKIALPRFEAYLGLARLFEALPALADTPVEGAFIDLANFGTWNTTHGEKAGDDLLVEVARHLRDVPRARAIRVGGDEFLLVGAPEDVGLERAMRDLAARWPELSRARFPDLPVVPLRAAITSGKAGELREGYEKLGLHIGDLKHEHPDPGPEGVVKRYA
jgi:GGDEF domain-containing protein